MDDHQEILNNLEEAEKNAFLREGLPYLISGVKKCSADMQKCSLESKEGQQQVFGLVQNLRSRIDFLCSLYSRWVNNQDSSRSLKTLETQKIITNGVHDQMMRLESELKLERRRSRRLEKANVKLKGRLRRLRTSLDRLKNGIGQNLHSLESKFSKSLMCQIQTLKEDLVKQNKEMFAAAEEKHQRTGDSLAERFQDSLVQTQSVPDQSTLLFTKIDQLSTNLKEKILEVPCKVKSALKLNDLVKNHQRSLTQKLTKIEAALEKSRQNMSKFSKSTEEKIENVFESLRGKLQQTLDYMLAMKAQVFSVPKKIEECCTLVSEKVVLQSEALTDKAKKISSSVNQLNELLVTSPIYKRLRERVSQLYEAHLRSSDQKEIEEMYLTVEKVKDYQEEGLIGENWTYLALKNHSSYMIGTKRKGLKLIENGKLLFCEKLPDRLIDLIYIEHLDCYFMDYNNKLYKKDINGRPAYLFLDLRCGNNEGWSFIFSRLNKKLIVNKDMKNISVINLESKEIEIEAKKEVGNQIRIFRLFGEAEDRIISATTDGYIILYKLNFNQKTWSVTSESKVELMKERNECPDSLAVCSKREYVFLEIGRSEYPFYCSRMAIFKLREDTLIKKACIDQYKREMGAKYAFECLGYFGTQIIWIGLELFHNGVAQVYGYETGTGVFKELQNKRVKHKEDHVVKIHKIGNVFYYGGGLGTIKQLRITF